MSEPTAGRKKRNGLTIRAYLGTCLVCRHGVFDGDDITRGRGKTLGLMHTACAKGAESHGERLTPRGQGSTNHQGRNGPQEAQE